MFLTPAKFFAFFCLFASSSFSPAQDYDSLIQQALSERNAGQFARAEQTLKNAYDIPTDKSEAGGLLTLIIAYQERYTEALELANQLLVDYPNNEQLQIIKARILYYQGNWQDARQTLEPMVARPNPNLDAVSLQGQINNSGAPGSPLATESEKSYRQQTSIGYAQSSFSRISLPDWHDRFIEYRLQQSGYQWYIRGDHQHHFNLHDSQITLGMAKNTSTGLPLEIFASASGDADFLPDYRLGMATRIRLSTAEQTSRQATAILVPQYTFSSYNNGDTHRLSLGMEYYLAQTNVWLTPSIGVVLDQDNQSSLSWGLGAHWQVAANSRIGGGYSNAPETENLITTDTETVYAYIRQNLGQSLILVIHGEYLDRDASYSRTGVGLTLQWLY